MMEYEADIAPVAALLADSGRAAIVCSLLDGRALPAGELARIAGVTAQTASAHLAKLVDGNLLTVVAQGRHRYYRLANAEVAHAIETLSAIAPMPRVRSLRQSLQAQQLKHARTCYDHLAGEVAVRIVDALAERGYCSRLDAGLAITPAGVRFFESIGIDVRRLCGAEYPVARTCIDWTERRAHISGPLGSALLHYLLDAGYARRGEVRRSIRITDEGVHRISALFDARFVDVPA